jgi:hypothetical protein
MAAVAKACRAATVPASTSANTGTGSNGTSGASTLYDFEGRSQVLLSASR